MGMRQMLGEMKAMRTEYICVLCGSIWTSEDYTWGACTEVRSGSVVRRCDWSCPQCGGVVVEYARNKAGAYAGEQTLAGTHL